MSQHELYSNSPSQPTSASAIFLGGTGRSGTSMLLSILGRHHQVALIPGESKVMSLEFLPALLKEAVGANQQRRTEIKKTIKDLWENQLYRYKVPWKDEEKPYRGMYTFVQKNWLEKALINLDTIETGFLEQEMFQAYGQVVRDLFSAHAQSQGKGYWVEKTPDNAIMAEFIHRCFPDFRFINIVRDGRDVACSLMRMPWGPDDPIKALDWWACRLVAGMNAVNRLPQGFHLSIRYEDLIMSYKKIIQRVLSFLDLDMDEKVSEYHVFADSIGRYKKDLPAHAQIYALEKYGDLLGKLGYLS